MTFWTLWNEHLLPKRSAKMIDRTEKPKIPSKFAKRDTNNLPVILYETMSWLPTQTGNLLSQPCLVPVQRFPSPSRSIRFGDASEANGRETPHIFAWTTSLETLWPRGKWGLMTWEVDSPGNVFFGLTCNSQSLPPSLDKNTIAISFAILNSQELFSVSFLRQITLWFGNPKSLQSLQNAQRDTTNFAVNKETLGTFVPRHQGICRMYVNLYLNTGNHQFSLS